jgi:ABC-type Fe3+-hydroxamate transport system substrate-binding protein
VVTPFEAARTVDDLGRVVPVPRPVERVVSLVPSLTETVARSAPGLLAGATNWCTHPADLDVVRVRGTKNPDVRAVIELAPDLVLANQEENRAQDLDALRAAGLAVYVTDIRGLAGAFDSLTRMLRACGVDAPAWLAEARLAWRSVPPIRARRRAVIPIWRRPWMALGRDTFAGDLLHRLGVDNVLAGAPERYPRFVPADLPAHDLVVLPDEPYRFTAEDGPESFPGTPAALVDGRLLTWYGPSLREAAGALRDQLRSVRGV